MNRFAIIENINRLSRHLRSGKDVENPEYFRGLIDQSKRELAVLDARETGASHHPLYSLNVGTTNARKFFASLFEDCTSSLFPCLIIDPRPGLHIIDVNAACEAESLKPRDRLIGQPLYDAIPDNPETIAAQGIPNTFAALAAAMATGEAQILPLQRYDVSDPTGTFLERYWRIESIPMVDSDGRVAFIRQEAFNITEDVLKHAAGG